MELSAGKIILLLVVALLLFGAKRLPEMGRAAGHVLREFKNATNGLLNDADPKPAKKENYYISNK
ncbi:twin-arginine translocase TatA/TatE family subunit [Camelliibacillus cellulosilyticus]|uniref:Sec-independent protein translocase protein TatA n=1 Tax=Camelliibacillus cellulosilyticus TaxID=2174486 RepID=A0ABV9GQZ4_9BACL